MEAAVQRRVAATASDSGGTLAAMPWMAGGRRNGRLAWLSLRPASRLAWPTQGAAACGVHNPQRAADAASARRSILVRVFGLDQSTGSAASGLHHSMQGPASAAAGPKLPPRRPGHRRYSKISIHAKLNCSAVKKHHDFAVPAEHVLSSLTAQRFAGKHRVRQASERR